MQKYRFSMTICFLAAIRHLGVINWLYERNFGYFVLSVVFFTYFYKKKSTLIIFGETN